MTEQHTIKSIECDSCGWETTELVETDAYARTPGHGPFTPDNEKTWGWLCIVCRSTFAGNAYCYPNQYENKELFVTIAWGINYLADQINKKE